MYQRAIHWRCIQLVQRTFTMRIVANGHMHAHQNPVAYGNPADCGQMAISPDAGSTADIDDGVKGRSLVARPRRDHRIFANRCALGEGYALWIDECDVSRNLCILPDMAKDLAVGGGEDRVGQQLQPVLCAVVQQRRKHNA